MAAPLPLAAIAALAGAGLLLLYVALAFNRLVRRRTRVREAFAGVDVQLARRHDLVPRLVEVVRGYARHERETLEEVVQARGAATQAAEIAERARTERRLERSLERLVALSERYPDLRADAGFARLHADLVSIEDDLQYARRYHNGTVRELNVTVEQFPSNVVAALFGFRAAPYFELDDPGQRDAARVHLDAGA